MNQGNCPTGRPHRWTHPFFDTSPAVSARVRIARRLPDRKVRRCKDCGAERAA